MMEEVDYGQSHLWAWKVVLDRLASKRVAQSRHGKLMIAEALFGLCVSMSSRCQRSAGKDGFIYAGLVD